MARCEDFPCCGHEPGCCPDFDEAGNQLNMKCTCGKTLPLDSRYSICESCLNTPSEGDYPEDFDGQDREYDEEVGDHLDMMEDYDGYIEFPED